jgi:hypothetical protein
MKNQGTVAGRLLAHSRNAHSRWLTLACGPKGQRGPARPMRGGAPRHGHCTLSQAVAQAPVAHRWPRCSRVGVVGMSGVRGVCRATLQGRWLTRSTGRWRGGVVPRAWRRCGLRWAVSGSDGSYNFEGEHRGEAQRNFKGGAQRGGAHLKTSAVVTFWSKPTMSGALWWPVKDNLFWVWWRRS